MARGRKELPRAFRSISRSDGKVAESWRHLFKVLIRAGLNLDQADIHGKTPLHIAVEREHCNLVEILVVDFGVHLSAADNQGCTPLDWARATGNEWNIIFLLKSGAKTAASEEGRFMMLGHWRPKERFVRRRLGWEVVHPYCIRDLIERAARDGRPEMEAEACLI